MVLHHPEQLTSLRHLPSWAAFAFAAGAVNAGAYLACKRFVAHVTGTVTLIGLDSGRLLALDYALVLAAFIAGALLAILIARKAGTSETPAYWLPLGIVTGILLLIAVLGSAGTLGPFSGTVETAHDFAFLAVLGFAMGMQNASVAASTAMAVRTTHMTGPTTDIAIALAMLVSGNADERATARRSLLLRGTKLAAFIVGAAVMAVLCPRVGYLGFLLPAFACAIATVSSFVPRRTPALQCQ